MGEAKMVDAPDGFKARSAPPWSEEKLNILDGYLRGGPDGVGGFAQACSRAGGWYGLDLFAGTGLNQSETSGQLINGSPLIALEASAPEATEVLIAESDPRAFAALEYRVAKYGKRARLFNRDANVAIGEMLSHVPKRAPAFAFLDPEGADVDWATNEAIAAHKPAPAMKIEQLVLLPVDMGFVRLAPHYPERVTRIYGHDRWRAIYETKLKGTTTPDQRRTDYVKLYGDGFRELGYNHVLDRQILKPDNSPLYFLIFATDHPAGMKIMDHVFDRVKFRLAEELGQDTLFDAGPSQRKQRLNGD